MSAQQNHNLRSRTWTWIARKSSRVSNVQCDNSVPECFSYFPDDALRFKAVEEEARMKRILSQSLYWMTPSRLTAVEVDAQSAAVN